MKAVYWFTIYLVAGIWSVIAPYALNFAASTEAFWNSVVLGALLILVSLIGLFIEREETAAAHFQHGSQRKIA